MENSLIREMEQKRTLYSKTYDLGGKYAETEISSQPVHYTDHKGNLKDINTDINSFNQWEFSHGVTSNLYNVYFGDNTNNNNHLVSVEFKDRDIDCWTNFKLKNSHPVDYKIENNKFTFIECFDNIDVEYIVESDKLKENIVLKQKTDIRNFEFTLKNGNVFWKTNENKELEICKKESGEIIWKIDSPYMIDSDGNENYGINYSIADNVLSVNIEDDNFINNAKYPIYIDPTTTLTYVTNNIQDGSFDTSNSSWSVSGGSLIFGAYGSSYYLSAINFNLGDTFAQSEIISAVLQLNLSRLDSPSPPSMIVTPNSFWSYSNLERNYETTNAIYFTPQNGLQNIEIANLLKYQLSNSKNNGFFILNNPPSDGNSRRWYISSSKNTNIDLRPKLTIKFIKKPSVGFHDGSENSDMYYTDGISEIYKYLDFGTMIAGTTSTVKSAFIRNLSDFTIKDVAISINNQEISNGVLVEISETRNPFVPTNKIILSNNLSSNQDYGFFVRIKTEDYADSGGIVNINANASPA